MKYSNNESDIVRHNYSPFISLFSYYCLPNEKVPICQICTNIFVFKLLHMIIFVPAVCFLSLFDITM